MPKITIEPEKCKACYYCVNYCPKHIIHPGSKLNRAGYKYIEIDEEQCVGCGTCYTICPDNVIEIINS